MTDIINFLETLYTPLVSDAMDKLGIHGRVLERSIQSMFFDPHLKVAGFGYPCRVVPTKEYVEIDTLLEMVDSIPNDSIVLVAGDDDIDAALWGGMMSTRSKARGARGAIVNGGVRDIEQIANIGFPIFGTYRCIKDIRTRGYMAEYNTKITIGGVEVSPGDMIFADINGVISIPENEISRVIETLHQALDHENKTMTGLQKGESAKELYSVYKAF
jgi:regulator of RNase E activity RraA